MQTATLHFTQLLVNANGGRLDFEFHYGGKVESLSAGISESNGIVNVSSPIGYSGPFNTQVFQQHAEELYRNKAPKLRADPTARHPSEIGTWVRDIPIDPANP